MKKEFQVLLALLTIPFLIPLVNAESGYMGQLIQSANFSQVGGSLVTTGAGATGAGTLRVTLASDSPAGNVTNVGTFAVQNTAALPAGAALIGKVGIDQTTDGTTNRVNATIASGQTVGVAAGVAEIGNVKNSGTFAVQAAATLAAETTKVIGTVNLSAGQTLGTVTTVGAVTAITNALPAGTNTIGAVTSPTVSAPTVAKVGATTASAQLIASNATRKGIEVDCDCSNTDNVAIKWGAVAAVYANDKIITPCGNWQPPPGVVVTSAIQIISNSGTQNCRVIEYP